MKNMNYIYVAMAVIAVAVVGYFVYKEYSGPATKMIDGKEYTYAEYANNLKNYIRNSGEASDWRANIQTKADNSGKTFEEQLEADVLWMWNSK